uniref:Uncharacterized protein n=1 Tax=Anguilla anguilla TaxID=7936 RepID=A0A0E9QFQ7_ANGAN
MGVFFVIMVIWRHAQPSGIRIPSSSNSILLPVYMFSSGYVTGKTHLNNIIFTYIFSTRPCLQCGINYF